MTLCTCGHSKEAHDMDAPFPQQACYIELPDTEELELCTCEQFKEDSNV